MLRYLPFLLVLGLWIFAFIDCLNTPEDQVRKLPKPIWVLIIVVFGYMLFGSLAWLIAGRPRRSQTQGWMGSPSGGRGRWVAPDDNPEFLKSLDTDRQKEQKEQKEQELRREQDRKRDEDRDSDDRRP